MKTTQILVIGFALFLGISTTAFAWPFGDSKKKTDVKSSSASSSQTSVKTSAFKAAPASAVSSGTQSQEQDDFFAEESEGEEAPLIPTLPEIPKVPTTNIPTTGVKIPGVQSSTSGGGQSAVQDPEIVRIQTQIREIMKINESLKTTFSDQAAQIQKIGDQAKIHGKILTDLESSRKLAKQATAENYLNQEKVRLIQKETDQNKKFLDGLKTAKPEGVAAASLPSSSVESGNQE